MPHLAVQYLRVYALCSPITTIVFAMDNYLRICGKIRNSMILNLFYVGTQRRVGIRVPFVFRWGIWGAALATCLGMCTCALLACIPFFRGKAQLRFRKPRFRFSMVKQILACGCPNF